MKLGLGFSLSNRRPGQGLAGGPGDVFVPVGARSRGIPGTGSMSTGAFDSFMGQNIFWGLADQAITEMKVAFADFEMSASGPVAKAAGAVFNNFSVGLNLQQSSQGDFAFGGNASATLGAPQSAASFGFVLTDAKAVNVPANNSFGIRMFGNMTVGTNYALAEYQQAANGTTTTRLNPATSTPGGSTVSSFGEGLSRANGQSDTTAATSSTSHTGLGYFPPAVILAKVSNPTKSVVVFGDSIGAGAASDWPDNLGNIGYVARTLRNTIPWVNLSRGTIQAAFFNTSALRAGIDALSIGTGLYATDFACLLGRNDMAGSSDAATIKADVDFICAPQKAAGRQCWISTIPPWTTSSDAWTTTANQTLASSPKETIRNTYNNDRRSNHVAQGYRGVIDICTTLESDGKWAVPFAGRATSTAITTTGQTGNITVDTTDLVAAGLTNVLARIDSEFIYCSVGVGTLNMLNRGTASTTAATHSAGAIVHFPLTGDGIHPNFNGHELLRLSGVFAASRFGA